MLCSRSSGLENDTFIFINIPPAHLYFLSILNKNPNMSEICMNISYIYLFNLFTFTISELNVICILIIYNSIDTLIKIIYLN